MILSFSCLRGSYYRRASGIVQDTYVLALRSNLLLQVVIDLLELVESLSGLEHVVEQLLGESS